MATAKELYEQQQGTEKVAIVIPVLNEASIIEETLRTVQSLQPPADKIIVADGGSTDGTQKLVKRFKNVQLIQCVKGRGIQMNTGANAARNVDYVCFLHADTVPPEDVVQVIRDVFRKDERAVMGGFKVSIEVPGKKLRFTSFHNNLKTALYPILIRPLSYIRGIRLLFGDQVIFVRRKEFLDVRGFDEKLPLMEESDLCIRMHMNGRQNLKGRGKVHFVRNRLVRTSGRRIEEMGELKALGVHMLIGFSWYLGVDVNFLQQLKNKLYDDSLR